MDMPLGRALGSAAYHRRTRQISLADVEPGSDSDASRFGKHHGFIVTSASRAGSQKPTEMPMRGSGSAQAQIGEAGLPGSGRLLGQIFSAPTESGKRHDQQTSVIGLTNLPLQVGAASARGAKAPMAKTSASAVTIERSQRIIPYSPRCRGRRCPRYAS